MKVFKYSILALALFNVVAAIVALATMAFTEQYFLSILISIAFLMNGVAFFFIGILAKRLEILGAPYIETTKKKKELKSPTFNSKFVEGETVALKNFITLDEHTFRKNSFGKIAKVISAETYSILFDEDPTRTYIIQEHNLKKMSEL